MPGTGLDLDTARMMARNGGVEGLGNQNILDLKGDKTKSADEKLKTLAREFESIFVNQMLKTMRQTVEKSGLIDGGSAEEIFTEMQDEQLSRHLAFSHQSSLADALVRQMKDIMEAQKITDNNSVQAGQLSVNPVEGLRGYADSKGKPELEQKVKEPEK